jgi:hypothetical protein
MLTNEQILAQLDAAVKGLTTTSVAGSSVLEPAQFDRYVRLLQKSTILLPMLRLMIMTSNKQDIDRIGFSGRVMGVPAAEGEGPADPDGFTAPGFAQHQLISCEMQGFVSVTDKLMRRNIEKANFMQTILEMVAEASGVDIEEQGIKGDTDSADTFLQLNDGWLKKTRRRCAEDTNQLYDDNTTPLFTTGGAETTHIITYDKIPLEPGTFELWEDQTSGPGGTKVADEDGDGVIDEVGGSGVTGSIDYENGVVTLAGLTVAQAYATKYTIKSFDLDASSGVLFPENMFDRMIEALPKQYYKNPMEWLFAVPWWVMKKYRDILKSRNTQLGDTAQTTGPVILPYESSRVIYVPNMPQGKAWLLHPNNTIYGVFHEVQLEQEREAKKKRTDVVVNAETDYGFEEPEASVVADIYA